MWKSYQIICPLFLVCYPIKAKHEEEEKDVTIILLRTRHYIYRYIVVCSILFVVVYSPPRSSHVPSLPWT